MDDVEARDHEYMADSATPEAIQRSIAEGRWSRSGLKRCMYICINVRLPMSLASQSISDRSMATQSRPRMLPTFLRDSVADLAMSRVGRSR